MSETQTKLTTPPSGYETLEEVITMALNDIGWKVVTPSGDVIDHNTNSYEVKAITSYLRLYLYEVLLSETQTQDDIRFASRVRKKLGGKVL